MKKIVSILFPKIRVNPLELQRKIESEGNLVNFTLSSGEHELAIRGIYTARLK